MNQETQSLREIARAIAQGANQLLPAGFEAAECESDIAVFIRGVWIGTVGVGTILSDAGATPSMDDVVRVAEDVLNWLQDLVSEDAALPWPSVAGKTRSYMPEYRAAMQDGWLRLWFEADGRPVTPVAEVALVLKQAAEHRAALDGRR